MSSRLAIIVVLACWLTACSVSRPIQPPTLYERLGGKGALVVVVRDFVARVQLEPELQRHFGDGEMHGFEARLVAQLCELSGGPCRYTGSSMKTVHGGHDITAAEFDTFLLALRQSMTRYRIPDPEQKELLALLTPMRKDIVSVPVKSN